jgi:NAD(P)-dependent dehydrogenase (short-subunit alcohol dehydrogenase family)
VSWTAVDIPDQAGRIALVTGANSGLGFETARALAGRSATVILACRSEANARAAAAGIAGRVETLILDLASLDSVRAAAGEFQTRHDRLDLLINNAGVMAVPERRTTQDGFELQFGTNHLGHFALTGRLLPALLRVPDSRVVTVSSQNHRAGSIKLDDLQLERGYGRWRAYNQSKLANALFTLELDRRFRVTGAGTLSVGAHPGYTRTELQSRGPRLGGGGFTARMLGWVTRFAGQPASRGALPTLRSATDPAVRGGDYYGPGGPAEIRGFPRKVRYSRAAHDQALAVSLWAASESLTGVKYDFTSNATATNS